MDRISDRTGNRAFEGSFDKVERGQRAEILLKDPLLRQTLEGLEDEYVKAWKQARTLDAREDAHRLVRLIERFRDHLASLAFTGALTSRQHRDLEGREGFWR